MTIKIDYLRNITKEIGSKTNTLANLLDNYDCVAEESDIAALAEKLRYLADLVESIAIA